MLTSDCRQNVEKLVLGCAFCGLLGENCHSAPRLLTLYATLSTLSAKYTVVAQNFNSNFPIESKAFFIGGNSYLVL